ncbi:tetratricopeptide repeat protein [Actinophytocola gossypii]|uniref:Tetratricopeptide repeat protein n=1 Tax=Actinophytocola gossypii TaxID=2812003 RepID=A0ABT2JJD3_9PSEU|nr:tetratricopeptide repeat protein [Actinophytocola gossypii]MCT2587853.1 tetratricopeptide repeat protein [Actinophytocola gossypii]
MATLAKANALIDLGRHAEARTEITGYLAGEPDSVTALCLLARCELRLGDADAAVDAADRALATEPESGWALRLRALALSTRGDHRDAAATAVEAVRTDAQEWLNHYVHARTLLAAGDARGGHDAARRAVELAPHEADAHLMLGVAARARRRRSEERAAYQEALRLDPESSDALNNLAAMDIDRARLGRAARAVTAGLRLNPTEETLRRNLDAVALRLMGRLLVVVLVTGVLPMVVFLASEVDTWWVRASVGVVQLGAYTFVAWLTLRHLPAGARRHLRGLPGRMSWPQRLLGVVLVVFTLALMFAAFAPGRVWMAGAGVMAAILGLILRGLQIAFVVWLVRAAYRAVTGPFRRRRS